MTITLLQGDNRAILPTLPEKSVQCVITSPPYWQQRRYTDSPDEMGQEPTYQAYVEVLAALFDEVRRVLRDDGTLWINLGDAYANDTKWGGMSGNKNYTSAGGNYGGQRNKRSTGLPPKSLIGLPWRVAFALQDRGWILRTEIVWEKTNGMPEKVTDRPTRTHEYIFLFSKQPHYFCDMDALREESAPSSQARAKYNGGQPSPKSINGTTAGVYCGPPSTAKAYGQGRNIRTVWHIPTQALREEHYAPYPEELARRCVLAGSSPRACEICAAPWVRLVERKAQSKPVSERKGRQSHNGMPPQQSGHFWAPAEVIDHGFHSGCGCPNEGAARCVVLDCFAGSGTTMRVAERYGRDSIGIDLGYLDLSEKRTDGIQLDMESLL